jgi:hypothetical protein
MAKKPKTAEDLIYEIKDLLDDLQLKLDPDDNYMSEDEEDIDDELDIDEDEEE